MRFRGEITDAELTNFGFPDTVFKDELVLNRRRYVLLTNSVHIGFEAKKKEEKIKIGKKRKVSKPKTKGKKRAIEESEKSNEEEIDDESEELSYIPRASKSHTKRSA
jgi:hypothetical protein